MVTTTDWETFVLACDLVGSDVRTMQRRHPQRSEFDYLHAQRKRVAWLLRKMDFKYSVISELICRNNTHRLYRSMQQRIDKLAAVGTILNEYLERLQTEIPSDDLLRSVASLKPETLETPVYGKPEYWTLKIADACHVHPAVVMSRDRHQQVAHCRALLFYALRQRTRLSFPRIGQAINRDHSTVIHNCHRVEARMERDPGYRRFVEGLIAV